MSSIYQRFFLSKLTLAILIIFSIYILLRTIAFFVHQPIPLSGDYFSFEGKQVRYVCKGSGNPYVFFESGYGDDSEQVWSSISEQLPQTFTSCYYDRLGHGGSDDIPTDFTTKQKAQLQASLIQHVAGDNSVIIVARSYGGIIARHTAAITNSNLAALILLDLAHENQHEILRGTFSPIATHVQIWHYADPILGISDIKNLFKKYDSSLAQRLDQYYSSFRYAQVMSAYRNEGGFFTPLEDFNYDFGNLRMVVMSHDREAYKTAPRFYNVGDKWAEMQKSIAQLSRNSEHIVVKGATHNIPDDAPDVVISKIIETVDIMSKQPSLSSRF
ncbi:alpha/beta hydrolase [Pseudoalteromonas sp. S2755]|uniref:alpha/beta fold hydrolase n=1 Tax=Pseudoalteromonas sp. S2755 TaxID=2066523 RepID=UPI00110AF884|nr:alpha/beta hydrolase [Pseudoalteromonas sp. S2755]TMN33220.1 alpha/beta hydrolase [Pseudoalteromonas sp. S2755]